MRAEDAADSGLLACVNSDDPAYFGGYVDDNLAAVRAAFGYDDAAAVLARNSFDDLRRRGGQAPLARGGGRLAGRRQLGPFQLSPFQLRPFQPRLSQLRSAKNLATIEPQVGPPFPVESTTRHANAVLPLKPISHASVFSGADVPYWAVPVLA